MPLLGSVPEWLGTAVAGAVIAALGYVTKLVLEGISRWRKERAREIARLRQLASLLHASRETFRQQRKLVKRLQGSLDSRLPTRAAPGLGFERQFADSYQDFTAEEREIHRLIRSITEHGLRPLNTAMTQWLDTDYKYRNVRDPTTPEGKLATKLNQLDTHLRLWHAKYAAWIPEYPEHSLVYLADEEGHGLGFPLGLDENVEEVLGNLPGNSVNGPAK